VVLETAFTLRGQTLTEFCDTPGDEKPSHPEMGDCMSLHWVCTNTGFSNSNICLKATTTTVSGSSVSGEKKSTCFGSRA